MQSRTGAKPKSELLYLLECCCSWVTIRAAFTAVKGLSKYESRLFSCEITENLPRELRDAIFRMCWEEELKDFDHYEWERPWRVFDCEREEDSDMDCGCSGPLQSPMREKALRYYNAPHFANPVYVGEDAAREAVEAFYRTAPAYLETLSTEEVEDYFKDDNFDMGVVPRDHITSITFFLSACMGASHYLKEPPQPTVQSLSNAALRAMVDSTRRRIPPITFFLWQES